MIAPIIHLPTRTFVLFECENWFDLPKHKISKMMAFEARCDPKLREMIRTWDTFIIPEIFYPDGTSKVIDGWPK